MTRCDNEMIKLGVSSAIVCTIKCGEFPVTRDFITMPVS